MALTVTRSGYAPMGGKRALRVASASDITMVVGQFTFSSAYPAGGDTGLTPSAIGLKDILFVTFDGASTGTSGIRCEYDYTNQKVKAFGGSGVSTALDKEVPNGTNLSWATVRFIAFGR